MSNPERTEELMTKAVVIALILTVLFVSCVLKIASNNEEKEIEATCTYSYEETESKFSGAI